MKYIKKLPKVYKEQNVIIDELKNILDVEEKHTFIQIPIMNCILT